MKLSEAQAILKRFSINSHIDPALHEVFVNCEVYRSYASAFLPAHQVDC